MAFMSNFLKTQNNKGFALLFSIIVVSVVVITTLAVSSIVRRGLELTSVGERSMEAFFAADAGLECALYWDVKERSGNYFPRDPQVVSARQIECFGNTVTTTPTVSGLIRTYEFSFGGSVCADVEVRIDGLNTTVRSQGYDTCDASDPGRVERGLEAQY